MTSVATPHVDAGGRLRTYYRADTAVFLKTKEKHGGLSNMAGGFPLVVNGVAIRTSEALYQACRFPHRPEIQREIIAQKSPMTAKMKGKPYRHISRPDWDAVRVKIMRWCLQVKLAQNWDKFSELLLETGDMPIVEHSRRDDFWGAKPIDSETLVGTNALGRLLMQLRERLKCEMPETLQYVGPLAIPEFLLYGLQIEAIGQPIADTDTILPTLLEHCPYSVCEKQVQIPDVVHSTTSIAEAKSAYFPADDSLDLVNINTAEVKDLIKLPRIGKGLAQAIVDHRDKHGPFPSTQSIKAVPRIGGKIQKGIADRITVGYRLL